MRLNLAATLVLALVALAVRWNAWTTHDLYNDEALQTTITRSFLEDGSLNNFRYSRFTPDSQYFRGIWIYYPPGFNLIQAPFLFLTTDRASDTAARLPVLALNLIGLACLPWLARRIWGFATPGWIASILGALGVFHIGLSVTSVPYTLLAPLLLLAFLGLGRALDDGRRRHWLELGLLIALGFCVLQGALAFCGLLAVVAAWSIRHGRTDITRGALLALGLAVALCAPWVIWTSGMNSPLTNFRTRASDYSFLGQARLVVSQYDLMLPSPVLKLSFLAGLVIAYRRSDRTERLLGGLLVVWALSPALYFLSRNMWVTPRHVASAYVPVILIAAIGITTAARGLVRLIGGGRAARFRVGGDAAAIAVTTAIAVTQLLAARAAAASVRASDPLLSLLRGDAAIEFGAPDVVSRAAKLIRAHDRGEPVIAPVGFSEAHYLGRFVQDRRTTEATTRAWALVRSGPAWVFMGDNYLRWGELDAFDRAVQQRGRLIVRSAPVVGFTTPQNTLGYALYHLDRPLPP